MNASTYTAEQPEFRTYSTGGKWLSDNDDKAWAEKLYLWFIPLFFLISGIYSRSAWANSSSLMNLMQGVMLWLPYCVILPLILRRGTGVPFYRQWWFRFQLYIAVIVFLLSYFGTEYFFDTLGMRYHYEHLTWYLDSALLGPDQASALAANKRVPLGMYPTTMAFFTIYHITAIVFVRRIVRATQGMTATARRVAYAIALFAMACFFAFAETLLFMSAPSKTAWYIDLPTMLTIGTLFYSMDFIFTFPSIYRLDEDSARAPWSLCRIVIEAAAACMGALLLADLWTLIFGAPFA